MPGNSHAESRAQNYWLHETGCPTGLRTCPSTVPVNPPNKRGLPVRPTVGRRAACRAPRRVHRRTALRPLSTAGRQMQDADGEDDPSPPDEPPSGPDRCHGWTCGASTGRRLRSARSMHQPIGGYRCLLRGPARACPRRFPDRTEQLQRLPTTANPAVVRSGRAVPVPQAQAVSATSQRADPTSHPTAARDAQGPRCRRRNRTCAAASMLRGYARHHCSPPVQRSRDRILLHARRRVGGLRHPRPPRGQ